MVEMIYCDGDKDDLKLSEEVTDIIGTSLGHLAIAGLLKHRGLERMARSAGVLTNLGFVFDYADEITRQDGVRVCMDLMRVLQKLRSDYWMQDGFLDDLHTVYRMCWKSTPTGASARAQFIRLQGCGLLTEVLGDGTAAARPADTVYKVLLVLYTLCLHDDSSSAVKELPEAGLLCRIVAAVQAVDNVGGSVANLIGAPKDTIKRALTTHADYLKKQDWWTNQKATAKLLETLNTVKGSSSSRRQYY